MIYYTKIKAIEAVQLRWTQWNEVCDFLGEDFPKDGAKDSEDYVDRCGEVGPNYIQLSLPCGRRVYHGEYIIRYPDGTLFSLNPRAFNEQYVQA